MNMEIVMNKKETTRNQIQDIALEITWSKISMQYFGKSASWIYHKLNGIDGNGKPVDFNDEEKIHLKNALFDFSERVRRAAERIS
jgi:hypothetical protein